MLLCSFFAPESPEKNIVPTVLTPSPLWDVTAPSVASTFVPTALSTAHHCY